jgi:hypothetical protein
MVASKVEINKLSSFGTARATIPGTPLSDEEAQRSTRSGAPATISRSA